jgi:hypothetical protein
MARVLLSDGWKKPITELLTSVLFRPGGLSSHYFSILPGTPGWAPASGTKPLKWQIKAGVAAIRYK